MSSTVAKIQIKGGSGGRTYVNDLNKMNITRSVELVNIRKQYKFREQKQLLLKFPWNTQKNILTAL